MKLRLLGFFFITYFPVYAQNDTALSPLKIFLSGAVTAISGWEPTEGKFYSLEWYDYDSKPKNFSWSYGYGLMAGIKILKRQYLILGVDVLNASFDKFRLSPAPDGRRGPVVYDTIYVSYRQKAMRFPVGIQFPFFVKRMTLAARFDVASEFTFSESYERITSDTSNGAVYKSSHAFHSKVTRFTGARIESGLDVEFRNITGNTLLYLGINYSSPNISNEHLEKYFLSYGSTISFRFGIGYFFSRKEKEKVEYALLASH